MSFEKLKPLALLLAGPLGAYSAYHLLFVIRHLDPSIYPHLAQMNAFPTALLDIAGFLAAAAVSIFALKALCLGPLESTRAPLPRFVLAAIVLAVASLIAMSIYRVLGTLDPATVISEYARYQMLATDGGAWMILACYGALYVLLIDMFFGGVRFSNGAAFLAAVMIASISGGRGILILFVLAFLLLLLFQRVKPMHFIATALLSAVLMGASFVTITDLRDNRTEEVRVRQQAAAIEAPANSYEELNYNAAFITEDTLAAYQSGDLQPALYAVHDAAVRLVPRQLMPEKPISSGETYALYPEVAERGSNITFPLKANLMMHLGPWAYWLDWAVVALSQVVFTLGFANRGKSPDLWGFGALFFGCAFTLISRGGLLNARLIDQIVLVLLAYGAYSLTTGILGRYGHRAKVA